MIAWILFAINSWLFADFIAGAFHWWEDTYLTQSDTLLGRLIGGPNQVHHANQYAFLQGSYWHRNSTTIIPSMIALCLCLAVPMLRDAWLTMLFVSQANQIHAWCHMRGRNFWVVEELQWLGLLQSCKHHAEHHRSPFHVRYCVMSPMLNPLLDGIGFWRFMEYVVRITIGIEERQNAVVN